MSQNNLRQADVPLGARPIAQMPGTAPGLVCPLGDKVIYAVPGVPSEMREMMLGTILPDLRQRAGQSAVIRSRVLRTWGMSESGLAEVLAERMAELDELGNPTIAYQASGIDGIKVRLVAKCKDEATATQVLSAEEALIRRLLGDVIFGVDEQSMEVAVLAALKAKGMTLAVAEEVTGGLLAARMTVVDPTMATFRGARIAAASGGAGMAGLEARAAAAADWVQREFASTVGAAAIAGPARQAGGPVTAPVVLAARIGDRRQHEEIILPADRGRLRDFAVISLLNMLRKALTA
jgi:nicotinamide-nucleotide amidase